MARKRRRTAPGAVFHVSNRGIGKRTVFESRRDIRLFLAEVARAVHRGALEVHAYAVLQTHYHLLVRDVAGELSATMRNVLSNYARWFNRSRGRDGAVFKGRFFARLVRTDRDFANVVAYIHANPRAAGLEKRLGDYPYCSAHDLRRERPWVVPHRTEFQRIEPDHVWLQERELSRRKSAPRGLPKPGTSRHWVAVARRADGCFPGSAALGPDRLRAFLLRRTVAPVLQVGLWRMVCGLTLKEIGREIERSTARAFQLLEEFRALERANPTLLAPLWTELENGA